MELTRRHALAGAAALAATPLLSNAPANAAAPPADKQAPSFYRYKVGDVQVTVISDGVNTFALGDSFVLNAKKDEVAAAKPPGHDADGNADESDDDTLPVDVSLEEAKRILTDYVLLTKNGNGVALTKPGSEKRP